MLPTESVQVKSYIFSDFPTCIKLGVGSESGSGPVSNGKSDPDPDRHQNIADSHTHFTHLGKKEYDYGRDVHTLIAIFACGVAML
jgi:hypothetical protein